MKVHVDVWWLGTTRRADKRTTPHQLTIRQLKPTYDENGNYEAEVEGPRQVVLAWLKRNGYDHGSYDIVEL